MSHHHWHGGALREAEACARRALEIDPSEAKACNVLGQALDWQARHDEANDFLERAVTLNPSFALASTARSYHAVMTGEFDEAKVYIRTAMRLRVGDAGMGLCLPSKALADMRISATVTRRCRPRIGPCACSRNSGSAARCLQLVFPPAITCQKL